MSRKKKVTHGNPAARVVLYHYTHTAHLPSILASGELRTTESNVSFEKTHAGPDVVWLTTNPDLAGTTTDGLQMVGGGSKAQVRIAVSIPRREVHEWSAWARAHGSPNRAMDILSRTGGSETWRVVERPISRDEWLTIHGPDGEVPTAATT